MLDNILNSDVYKMACILLTFWGIFEAIMWFYNSRQLKEHEKLANDRFALYEKMTEDKCSNCSNLHKEKEVLLKQQLDEFNKIKEQEIKNIMDINNSKCVMCKDNQLRYTLLADEYLEHLKTKEKEV